MIWNSNTHKGFNLPSQGIWQWLLLNNTRPTHLKVESGNWHARFTFYYQANQISSPNQIPLPNQSWRSIHHQLDNPYTCNDQIIFCHHIIVYGMFLVAKFATTIFFGCCLFGDGNFLIVTGLAIENSWSPPLIWQSNFQSPSLWWLKIFHHQLCDNWESFITTSLVIEIFWLP